MSAILKIRTLTFSQAEGDYLSTGRVTLDTLGPTYRIVLRWSPVQATWNLDLATTSGTSIVSGTWVRDRVDCLLGVSTVGRPKGAIVAINPKTRADPDLDSFVLGVSTLYYVPAGLRPKDFTLYTPFVGE